MPETFERSSLQSGTPDTAGMNWQRLWFRGGVVNRFAGKKETVKNQWFTTGVLWSLEEIAPDPSSKNHTVRVRS
jgi:hypothetical protein